MSTCEYCKLSFSMTFQDPVEFWKSCPLDSRHLISVKQLAIHILSELLKGHDGLVRGWDGTFDDAAQVLVLNQCLQWRWLILSRPNQRTALHGQFPWKDLWCLPWPNVSSQPQCHSLELLQVGEQNWGKTADSTRKGDTWETRCLAHSQTVQLMTGQHHFWIHPAYESKAKQAVIRAKLWECSFIISDFVSICPLGWKELDAL